MRFILQEKLPNDPIILVLPQIVHFSDSKTKQVAVKTRRLKLWNLQLTTIAKLVYVPAPKVSDGSDKWRCFDEMVTQARAAIIEACKWDSFCVSLTSTYPNLIWNLRYSCIIFQHEGTIPYCSRKISYDLCFGNFCGRATFI